MSSILVVDDIHANLELAKTLLEHAGYEVLIADNAAEGFRLAVEAHPGLALVDLHMPGVSGQQLAEMLRADRRTGAIPVVVFTATASLEELEHVREAGFSEMVAKPVDAEHFTSAVAALLEKYGRA